MHRNRHIVGFLLILAIVLCSFTGIKTYAAEGYVATPKFSLKRINKGTGVKIVIEKTEGATSYYIYMTKRDNAYSKYLKNKGTYDEIVKYAAANKSKNTVVTLSGLPKGKYSFKIMSSCS